MSLRCGESSLVSHDFIWRWGIEGVFTSSGKQHDTLKKITMDKTLETKLK
jgi:hypothetical protein